MSKNMPLSDLEKRMHDLEDQRDELLAALTELGAAAFSISNHNHAGLQPLDCLWADLHQSAEHAKAVIEKVR